MNRAGTIVAGLVAVLMVAAGVFLFVGGTPLGVIKTELGEIAIEFFPDVAPNHVANWKKLARDGFYDGTTFHRVAQNFVIQGGDPNSKDKDPYNDGEGGPGWFVSQEFNDVPHERGIVSMARGQFVNSAGSQFFICLARIPYLDGQYTVFGRVIEGMDTVNAIVARPFHPEIQERPLEPVRIIEASVQTLYRVPLIGEFRF
jgi:cyclophilin family peptidyl-prolyl cis-trans isomerase